VAAVRVEQLGRYRFPAVGSDEMAHTRIVPLHLTVEEQRVIRELAELRRITPSDLIREAMHLPALAEALNTTSPRNPERELEVVGPPPSPPARRP
jgi:hypothetical protein